ncbi:MAG: DNA polymerase III subunit beta [Bacteroidales bacterium]|nr:DNA polymerase III subunit beta [Bacteroidales bacterium]
MEFIVSSNELLGHLSLIKGVINSKNTLPILDNFLFNLENNVLKITASDLESTLNTQLSLDNATGDGVIAIEAKRLFDMLKEFSDQPLTFKIDMDTYRVDIFSGNGKFSIVGQNGKEFPKLPELNASSAASFRIDSTVFLKGINSTIFATADDELRPVMNGIYIELTADYFRMVATDSHKLVRFTRHDIAPGTDASFILPKKSATILKNILAKDGNDIKIEFDEKNAFFSLTDFKLTCRLIEGKYPAYGSVIPINNPNKLTIDRHEFYNSMKRVSLFANQASNLSKLTMKGTQLTISAQDIDFSISAYENLNCLYDGDPMDIGFKSGFLLEILSNIHSVDVNLEMSDPSRAGILTPVDKDAEGEDVLMLIMPMMV